MEPKKGFQTTEFWLSVIAMILGFVMASGFVPESGMAAQIVGGVMAILASLGYTASRTQFKVAAENSKAKAPVAVETKTPPLEKKEEN